MKKNRYNLTLDEYSAETAKRLNFNLSQIATDAITAAVAMHTQGKEIDLIELNNDIEDIQKKIIDLQTELSAKISQRTAYEYHVRQQDKEHLARQHSLVDSLKASGVLNEF